MNSSNALTIPTDLEPSEEFTRFLVRKEYFARTTGRVTPPALMPMFNAESQRWETSTFRNRELAAADIWKLGYANVENIAAQRTIKARAIGSYTLVAAPLSLDVNGPPYPRHVDIVGWSAEKNVRMQHATNIADKLTLELDPRR
jgi:hypothetical protein